MTPLTNTQRADLVGAVLEAAPTLSVAHALDVVDAVAAALERHAVAALFESAGTWRKGTRPSPPRSAGENVEVEVGEFDDVVFRVAPHDHIAAGGRCLMCAAAVARPSRRLEHMPGRTFDPDPLEPDDDVDHPRETGWTGR